MTNGWIKLHKKSLESEVRRKDPTAWRLFETLLLLVDSKTGVWSGGRLQLSEADGVLNQNTIYKALQRLLKKWQMVTLSSNNRYSTISIVNWHLYQQVGNSNDNNKVTTDEQQSNTIYKEIRTKKDVHDNFDFADEQIAELRKKFNGINIIEELDKAKDWCSANGKTYKNYLAFFRNWLRRVDKTGRKSGYEAIEEYQL